MSKRLSACLDNVFDVVGEAMCFLLFLGFVLYLAGLLQTFAVWVHSTIGMALGTFAACRYGSKMVVGLPHFVFFQTVVRRLDRATRSFAAVGLSMALGAVLTFLISSNLGGSLTEKFMSLIGYFITIMWAISLLPDRRVDGDVPLNTHHFAQEGIYDEHV